MRNILTLIIIVSFCICCDTKKIGNNKDVTYLKIDINEFIHHIDISKYFEAEFIPLETTSQSLIGEIEKVMITSHYIFVLDKTKANKLFMFDRKGKFIRTVGKTGKGPNEYLVLTDFDIDENSIYISSQRNNKMLRFDFDGNFRGHIKFSNYIGMQFKLLGNSDFIVKNSDGSNKSAIFYNKNGKINSTISNPAYTFLRRSNTRCFAEFHDDTFMYFALNDTIYRIDNRNKELVPVYVFDFGDKTFPILKIHDKEELERYLKKPYMHIETFVETKQFYYLNVYDNRMFYKVLIDKSNNEVVYANTLVYKKISIGNCVGYTTEGPILTWDVSSMLLTNNKDCNKSDNYSQSNKAPIINDNVGIVILSGKNKEQQKIK